jgi:hypothetical protein
MRTDQANRIQTGEQAVRVTDVFDRDVDLLRARVWERSARAVRMQRLDKAVLTAMAIVLGSVAGWAMVR